MNLLAYDSQLSTLVMSKSLSGDDNRDISVLTDTGTFSQEQSIISRLKKGKKQDEFVINNLKCHNLF